MKSVEELRAVIRDYAGWPDPEFPWDLEEIIRERIPEEDLSDLIRQDIMVLHEATRARLLMILARAGRDEVLKFVEPIEATTDGSTRMYLGSIYAHLGVDRGYEILRDLAENRRSADQTDDYIPLDWILEVIEGIHDPRAHQLRERISELKS